MAICNGDSPRPRLFRVQDGSWRSLALRGHDSFELPEPVSVALGPPVRNTKSLALTALPTTRTSGQSVLLKGLRKFLKLQGEYYKKTVD